jgi:gluconokinase
MICTPRRMSRRWCQGTPLNDEDRWHWLATVAEWIGEHIDAGEPSILTCSALKQSYRDVLRGERGEIVVPSRATGSAI